MKRFVPAALLAALPLLAACGGNDRLADAERARDLEMALQAQRLQNPAMVSPMEMGQQQGGQWVYVPPGYAPPPGYAVPQQQVYQPAPMPVYAPAPQPVYRTASATRSAPARQAPARAPERVTHVKRDAVIGAAAGAVAGAAIGRNVKGAVIGAAAGGLLGAAVGATVDVDHR
ncbi:MAG TPA: YMGG-like glycine zipper-containing protein [Gemmatimonadales bacterium]